MGLMRLGPTIWISWTSCSMSALRCAGVEDLVDVVGQGVELIVRGHDRGLAEQLGQFFAASL